MIVQRLLEPIQIPLAIYGYKKIDFGFWPNYGIFLPTKNT